MNYSLRKTIELVMAVYGLAFGTYVVVGIQGGATPLAWASFSVWQSLFYGYSVATFGLIHAIGVWVNGMWRYSPFLRVFGMAGHAIALSILSYVGLTEWSTAGITYLGIFACFICAMSVALDDTIYAMRYGPRWMK